MHYELINKIERNHPSWQGQKERVQVAGGKVITLSPDPLFRDDIIADNLMAINLIDQATGRTVDLDPAHSLFFNKIPTVVGAEIFMNEDFTIDVIVDGDVIGHVKLFPNTRRHVKEVDYVRSNGELDYIEEFTSEGTRFSNIIYARGDVHRIDFYNDEQNPVLNFYFYQGNLNLITMIDFRTLTVTKQFNSLVDFFANQVGTLVTEEDTVGICFMGYELFALSQSKSQNSLYLSEPPLDETGEVKGNLQDILTNRISYVQEVYMTADQRDQVKEKGLSLEKVRVI